MKIKQYPTQNELREMFEYRDGELYWRNFIKGTRGKNKLAGSKSSSDEYFYVCINGSKYKSNRLIWIYHYGDIPETLFVDHINRNRCDDRIENLRLLPNKLNLLNNDKKNVRFRNDRKKWQAYFMLDRKFISKHFDTEQEATEWVTQKKSELFQNFQDGGLT